MRTCPNRVCAECTKSFRPWDSGNLCWPCYFRTVQPVARVKQPKEKK